MADMYERIDRLLAEKGITGAKMSCDLGMSRSFMTELRKGRAKSVKIETAQKIANYLGVSVEYLTTGIPANIYTCPDDENPWEVELLDAFDQLDIDHQIKAVEHVQNMVAFSDDSVEATKKAPALTEKDERDIAKDLELMMTQLDSGSDLMFDGDPISDEARESIRSALKMGLELAKMKNKERFTPKKYRKD